MSRATARRIGQSVLALSAALLVACVVVLRPTAAQATLLAPVVLAFLGALLTLLSLRARDRAERSDGSG